MSYEDPTGLACGGSSSNGKTDSVTVCARPKLILILPGGARVTHGREYKRAIEAYRHPNSAAARHFSSMGLSFKAAGLSTPSSDDDSDDYPDLGPADGLQRSILPPGGMERAFGDFYGPQFQLGMFAFGGVLGEAGEAYEFGKNIVEGGEAAKSSLNGLKLSKQLASEAQMGEAGQPIAGAGSKAILRDATRLAKQYGGDAGDWAKMSSSRFRASDGSSFETHWYQNVKTGEIVEYKSTPSSIHP